MGLDMYAFSTKAAIPAVDFARPADAEELYYWRKHPNLHGWMERLYRIKGGVEPDFNCTTVQITLADLYALKSAVTDQSLPLTEGFFFGHSNGDEQIGDLEFIQKARDAISNGFKVFYVPSW